MPGILIYRPAAFTAMITKQNSGIVRRIHTMNYAYLIIPLGAVIGTVCRWKISVAYNNLIPYVPLGTLIVNLAGSYLIGLLLPLPVTILSSVAQRCIAIGFP